MSSKFPLRGGAVTPHLFYRLFLILLIVVGVGWYASFQARNFIEGPAITLKSPGEAVQHDRMITIEGTAENIVSLTLNGSSIFTDEAGNFEERLVLENGYTIMTLTATDRYGRETKVSRPFVYTQNNN